MNLAPTTIHRVCQLADAFRLAKDGVDTGMREVLLRGHDLGTELDCIGSTMEQGAFALLLDQAQLSRPMATRLVKLARTTTRQELMAGGIRQGLLQLQIVPPKERATPAEDRRLDALPHISAIALHWRRVSRLLEIGQLKVDREQVKKQTVDLFQWLKPIHEA